MNTASRIKPFVIKSLKELYNLDCSATELTISLTKPEFEGDYTIVLFSFVKQLKKSPEQTGKEIGDYLLKNHPHFFESYNVIKGFLNLTLKDSYWNQFLNENYSDKSFGLQSPTGKKVIVEYSSPNTNKPLHLGHLRNIFLGWSIAEILKAQGNEVIKTSVVNDRGIHICKSMIAWQLFANGATPESTGMKGDHFVGEYYVKFNDEYKKQVSELLAKGWNEKEAEKEAPVMKAAQQMLLDWEAGNPEVINLWKKMNGWVYDGFDITFKRIGADFTKMYYESNTYLLGKKFVEEGLKQNIF